jgi:hypothetical protein
VSFYTVASEIPVSNYAGGSSTLAHLSYGSGSYIPDSAKFIQQQFQKLGGKSASTTAPSAAGESAPDEGSGDEASPSASPPSSAKGGKGGKRGTSKGTSRVTESVDHWASE